MKHLYLYLITALITLSFTSFAAQPCKKVTPTQSISNNYTPNNPLYNQLQALPYIKNVEQIAGGKFLEKYILQIEQYRNPNDTSAGTFLQRVIVGHIHPDSAVVLHTHGYYAADHKEKIQVRDEISELLNTNNIWVEHRYFGTSCPADTNWNEVTTANAAADLHRVVQLLKTIYKGKWLSTGGSKDGITATLLSMYYPQDIDVAVPYVAPFCYGQDDPKIIPFIHSVGSERKRQRILNFQREALARRDSIQPMLKHYCDSLNMRFIAPFEMIYDYCILDYDFGIWMRGIEEDTIPLTNVSNKQLLQHIIKYANPDMCDRNNFPIQTYYVQAAKELGYYAYDYQPFKDLLSDATLNNKDFVKLLYLPEGDWDFSYSDSTYHKVINFLNTTNCKLLFIYGETDAWTAFRIPQLDRDNIQQFTLPNGCHYSRIQQFDQQEQDTILNLLKTWLQDK